MTLTRFRILMILTLFFLEPVAADGNTLLKHCKTYIAYSDGVFNSQDGLEWGMCYGTIRAYKESLTLVSNYRSKGEVTMHMLNNCSFDKKYSELQLARVLVKYLEDNPKLLHYWNIGLIDEAMAQSFPCE
jgi:hypothetical protein